MGIKMAALQSLARGTEGPTPQCALREKPSITPVSLASGCTPSSPSLRLVQALKVAKLYADWQKEKFQALSVWIQSLPMNVLLSLMTRLV
ncbi:uncharacterized protein LOC131834303 isoform X3 [Mustela lutreola]|uniref:uncharacterized protein LOC131834303 isoform X3 n=1 Tax=Mustela lutreola TaxID=9666 RepID=UPI0027971547|nr:uncharacterized protein LOC131834303 isoform X3 [Mustela lutreola]